jgi:hypothetical protein
MINNQNDGRDLTPEYRELNDNELDVVVGGSSTSGPQPPVPVWRFHDGIPLKYTTPSLS